MLSGSAAVWMASGLFRGGFALGNGAAGLLIGVGLTMFSYRSRRPSLLQYMVLPAAGVVGAVLALTTGHAAVGEIFHLVTQAVRAGGLGDPPIPFDPGWQFILVVVGALLGAASLSLAVGHARPQIGAFFPLPFIFATGLVLPGQKAILYTSIALGLFVGSLLVGYGVELDREGATSRGFEVRRLLRGTVVVAVLTVQVVILGRLGFLFPAPRNDQKAPPRLPQSSSLLSDRILFNVQADGPGPWRLGTLDIYRSGNWLLPPVDTGDLQDLATGGAVAGAKPGGPGATAKFTIARLEGHVLPTSSNPRSVTRRGFAVSFDPRTQTLRLPDKSATNGLSYAIESPVLPKAEDLANSPPPPASVKQFLEAPIPPNEVAALLAGAPANLWERLGFVRNALYSKVVAAGPGQPGKVPPAKVVGMLAGKEANPYEITAADVLLARWAGVPARIGYGFLGGDKKDPNGKLWEVHPKHGSTWLEAYFQGHGWVAITGVPLKAKGSLSHGQKQANQNVEASDDLNLVVYVPVRLQSIFLLYQVIRYWVLASLPPLLGLLLVWAFYPGLVKAARRVKRTRWAQGQGHAARILTAYAEFRDAAYDLNVGGGRPTPLEFTALVEPDPQHLDLAWLVSRSLWGDLRRDLNAGDAEAAEYMAGSATKRLRKAQLPVTRILAFASRASLRDPYTLDIPNLWRQKKTKAAGARKHGTPARLKVLFQWLRRALPVGTVLIGLLAGLVSCQNGTKPIATERTHSSAVLPGAIAPATIRDYQLQREPGVENQFLKAGHRALINKGQVFTIRRGPDVEGYFQIAAFKRGVEATRPEVRQGVLDGMDVRFEPTRLRSTRIYSSKSLGQRYFVYFPDDGRYFELLVAKDTFQDADQVFAALLAHQRGENITSDSSKQIPQIPDLRRGGDE